MGKRPTESVRDGREIQKMKETRRDRHRPRRQRRRKKAEEGKREDHIKRHRSRDQRDRKRYKGEREHDRAENPVMEPRREGADQENGSQSLGEVENRRGGGQEVCRKSLYLPLNFLTKNCSKNLGLFKKCDIVNKKKKVSILVQRFKHLHILQ